MTSLGVIISDVYCYCIVYVENMFQEIAKLLELTAKATATHLVSVQNNLIYPVFTATVDKMLQRTKKDR